MPTSRSRSDATRNRDRLVVAARSALAADSGEVTLAAIAAEAGVGIGTLYRAFPTREDLIEAVYLRERDELAARAPDLLAAHGPTEGLRRWMQGYAEFVDTKRDLAGSLQSLMAAGRVTSSNTRAVLSEAVEVLLTAGRRSGEMRADVEALDVVVGLLGISLACRGDATSDQADKLRDLLLDGILIR